MAEAGKFHGTLEETEKAEKVRDQFLRTHAEQWATDYDRLRERCERLEGALRHLLEAPTRGDVCDVARKALEETP